MKPMKLKPCPDCEREVSINALTCPHCGLKLKQEQTAVGVLAAILIPVVIAWVLYSILMS